MSQETKVSDKKVSPKLETIEELLELMSKYYTKESCEKIFEVYKFSESAHEGQIRRSGEPYISHPIGVASILAKLNLDYSTVATGLLHDTVEDTGVTLEELVTRFGKTIAELVDGVTKINQIKFRNTHEKQGENIRKMIVAMGQDVRVVLVKLADRLHNMRTLNHMPYEKQVIKARETLDIYAPLAGRLGMMSMKVELEDLSFRYSMPDQYYSLVQKINKKKKEREKYIEDVIEALTNEVKKRVKFKFKVYGRSKHLYSVYKKMTHRNVDYDQLYDLLAFRVVVNTIPECYEILGIVHSVFKPIPGRFKDFIAMAKANNYQSLHTTVVGLSGERIEIQIRTKDMHDIAERGIAAHWQYKEGASVKNVSQQAIDKFNWLRDLVSMHQQTHDSDEFLENIKKDLYDEEIYVFTPNGDVKAFPDGSTPIDFAFSIHTDVGSKIVAARINGKLVPLKHELQNGDTVEIITSKNQKPSKDWLNYCVTTKARSKIRAYVKIEQRKRAMELGREILEKAFRKEGRSPQKYYEGIVFEKYLKDNGANSLEDLFMVVGYGKLAPRNVLEALVPDHSEVKEQAEESFLQKAMKSALSKKKSSDTLVIVDGMDDVLVRFAKCCNPIPGDAIVGFIALGRGITIHKADCEKTFEIDAARKVDVAWTRGKSPTASRMVRMRVISHDIPGLLKQMTEVMSASGTNIHNAQIRTTRDKKAICIFDISVRDTEQLEIVMLNLNKLKGVLGVSRITHS
ncbi:MAG: bifunctional (p)ppGpp synthetase/guanosine-3',5'-bis(diphosphate) 3'-pyrophosphohydrolase [Bdellovibrionaceae bacterium]|nr:bifunctional (p)ppGpp synthetase/guanosine-3',5'-bis(diphosphate) 3'-pyrophosphohydrolase [Pseudobdellovibrionaceae bacterium]